ncbi:MAG: hypothetical protein GKR88_15125 [Flavobacteriaceae bacterium]|nr:MAG: hypothetical protein GKR88_15125 [Flavobacteriaceae bacterium]
MKNKFKILIAFFSLLILMILYNLLNYKVFIDDLLFDKNLLDEQYSNYSLDYFDSQPKENNDIKNLIKWSKRTSNFKSFKILNLNNVLVNYDSTIKKSKVFYSNGGKKNILLSEFTFFEYLFNKKNSNILLSNFAKPIFNCAKLSSKEKISNEVILSQFELFKEEISLLGNKNSASIFYKQLNEFEKIFNDEIPKPRKLSVLWFIYKEGKVKIVCADNFSIKKTKLLLINLEKYFDKIDTEYFDYSLFALRLFSHQAR